MIKSFITDNKPCYRGEPVNFKIGYYAQDGSLTDVTETCTYTIIKGNIVLNVSKKEIIPNYVEGVVILVQYPVVGEDPNETYISFYAIPRITYKQSPDNVYAQIKREEPDGLFSSNQNPLQSPIFVEDMTFSRGVSTYQENIDAVIDNSYINSASSNNLNEWYNQFVKNPILPNNRGLLWFLQNVVPECNSYTISTNLSRLIYEVSGIRAYVYIDDQHGLRPITWLLGISQLNINTVLNDLGNVKLYEFKIFIVDPTHEVEEFNDIIEYMALAWKPLYTRFTIGYVNSVEDLGLDWNLEDTYRGDPRANGYHCVKYVGNDAVELYVGYAPLVNYNSIVNITIDITDLVFNTPTPVNVTVEYFSGVTEVNPSGLILFADKNQISYNIAGNQYVLTAINPLDTSVTVSFAFYDFENTFELPVTP